MLLDARELPEDHVITAPIAIIGAGAAGIAMACELADRGHSVALLESGGLSPDADTQRLNEGVSVGLTSPALVASRLRFFGGTTNHWTGQCGPLDPIDFEARDWIPHSGWPIDRSDVNPYYDRAMPYCELGPMAGFDAPTVRADIGLDPIGFDPDRLETFVYQMSPPTRFGQVWRDRLADAPSVAVYLHANVIEILSAEGGSSVRELRCGTLTGRRFSVRAQHYVVAAGGIENARLLLASNSVVPAGLGNGRDLVGRFFMNHFNVQGAGRLVFSRPQDVDARFYDFWAHNGVQGRAGLRIPGARLRQERLLSAAIMMWPEVANLNYTDPARSDGVDAFTEVIRSLADRRIPEDFLDESCLVINDRRAVATFLKRRILRAVQNSGGTVEARLQMESEQSPNPDSRVTLTLDRDAFDVPRPSLDWRVADLDIESIRRTQEFFGLAVGAAGIGRYQSERDDSDLASPGLTSTFHHMGTTRMGTSSATSGVDANCRVHDVANLHVAGSSVFPTAGRSNPTLTIVALAIRLAEHLGRIVRDG